MALKQYSLTNSDLRLDAFLENYSNKRYKELIPELNSDVQLLESLRIHVKKHEHISEWLLEDYLKYAEGLLSIVGYGIKPQILDNVEINKLKPIIVYLVENEDLNEKVLSYFD